jgi:hypothetical protein
MSRDMRGARWRVVIVLLLLAVAAGFCRVDARVGPSKATQKDAHDDGTIVDWPDTVAPPHATVTVGTQEPAVACSSPARSRIVVTLLCRT